MVQLLESGVRIVNIDESLLKKTSFHVKTWGNKHSSKYCLGSTLNPAISLIATIDTEGCVFFSVSTVNTNTSVMRLFLNELRTKYTARDGGNMRETVVLLDGAGYHVTKDTIAAVKKTGFGLIFSGPYSFDAAPCEKVFGVLKKGLIRDSSLNLGKK